MLNIDLLSTKNAFIVHVRHKLGQSPIDYSEMWETINGSKLSGIKHAAAGVLLLLHDRRISSASASSGHEFVLQLIKRSTRVSQGGDISCPGGMLDPLKDRVLSFLTFSRLVPAFQGLSRDYARDRSSDAYRLINLFLANAMRESWEEIRLNPFNVDFMGPLPTYSLSLFRRTIFPLVAYVKSPWRFRPNAEVDKVIEIPLKQFFDMNNYGWFTIESALETNRSDSDARHFPCFVHQDSEANQEILWGATFNIIMKFLDIVFHFQLMDIPSEKRYRKVLSSDYLTGRPQSP